MKNMNSIVPASRSGFFVAFLAVIAVSHAALAVTWWGAPTASRVAGVDWVAGWMNTGMIATLWTLAAVLAALGVGLAVVQGERARGRLIWIGAALVVIPGLVGGYFLGASALWWSTGGQAGSASGWVTASAYLTRALITAFALTVHTGHFDRRPRWVRRSHE